MENKNYTKAIITSLKDVGIPASLLGYNYLKSAIALVLEDDIYLRCITGKLYPTIAAQFSTTRSRVERGIRHAVEVAFDCMTPEEVKAIFGRCGSYYKGKVTNSQFIAILAEKIRMDEGFYD